MLITSLLLVYFGFPADFGALIGEIAHRPFARPTNVALVPATFLELPMSGPVQFGHPAFRRIACLPILPAAVVCHSAGSIDFAPADSVVAAGSAAIAAATDFAWTAAVAFDSVAIAGSVGSADSAGFVVAVAAGSVV